MNRLLTIVDSKYQRLEYLESTGTQYIDTGYVPIQGDNIEIVFKNNSLDSSAKALLSAGTGTYQLIALAISTTLYVKYFRTGTSTEFQNTQANKWYSLKMESNGITSLDDNTVSNEYQSALDGDNTSLYLFCRRDGTSFFKGAIKNIRVTNNGVTKLNLVPVLRKTDNELGMLDLVEGKFYPNAGTGKFTANLDTMYALIQGTPTVQDGRVSNFSSSNYLKTQSLSVSVTNWELVLNIKSNTQTAFLETKNRDILIRQYSATQVVIFMSSQGNTTYDIASNLFVPLTISTNAWLKISFTGSSYVFSVSYDGINYEVKQTISSSSQIQNLFNSNYIKLGYSSFIGSAYNGVINLNRSSITIGSTKYKLQAVVGYTIVGSPTIDENGVASGFSTSNYLKFDLDKNVSNITEYVFKFKLTSEGLRNQYNYLFRRGNFQFSIYGTTTNFSISSMYLPTYNQSVPLTGFVPVVDNWYWVKYTYDGTTVKLYSSTDGITWTIRNTVTNITVAGSSGTFYLGFADTNVNSYFGGEIDLNETYIKVDNKLWFNGLEQ